MFTLSRLGLAVVLAAGLLALGPGQAVVQAEYPVSPDSNVYVVQPGDDLWRIGSQVGVNPEKLAEANQLGLYEPLEVGQKLAIPDQGPGTTTHRVRPGENLWSIASTYGASVASLIKANNRINPDKLRVGQTLVVPASARTVSRGTNIWQAGFLASFDWPVIGPVTSPFGQRPTEFHQGIDIAADRGINVNAARAGTVVYSGWISGYGLTVEIDHGDGFVTLYGHNSKLLVKQGQRVAADQTVAKVGSTGHSTGPHVHFEVRYDGVPQNPMAYLKNASVVADLS